MEVDDDIQSLDDPSTLQPFCVRLCLEDDRTQYVQVSEAAARLSVALSHWMDLAQEQGEKVLYVSLPRQLDPEIYEYELDLEALQPIQEFLEHHQGHHSLLQDKQPSTEEKSSSQKTHKLEYRKRVQLVCAVQDSPQSCTLSYLAYADQFRASTPTCGSYIDVHEVTPPLYNGHWRVERTTRKSATEMNSLETEALKGWKAMTQVAHESKKSATSWVLTVYTVSFRTDHLTREVAPMGTGGYIMAPFIFRVDRRSIKCEELERRRVVVHKLVSEERRMNNPTEEKETKIKKKQRKTKDKEKEEESEWSIDDEVEDRIWKEWHHPDLDYRNDLIYKKNDEKRVEPCVSIKGVLMPIALSRKQRGGRIEPWDRAFLGRWIKQKEGVKFIEAFDYLSDYLGIGPLNHLQAQYVFEEVMLNHDRATWQDWFKRGTDWSDDNQALHNPSAQTRGKTKVWKDIKAHIQAVKLAASGDKSLYTQHMETCGYCIQTQLDAETGRRERAEKLNKKSSDTSSSSSSSSGPSAAPLD